MPKMLMEKRSTEPQLFFTQEIRPNKNEAEPNFSNMWRTERGRLESRALLLFIRLHALILISCGWVCAVLPFWWRSKWRGASLGGSSARRSGPPGSQQTPAHAQYWFNFLYLLLFGSLHSSPGMHCYKQCCGSGMFIPDPGSKNSNKRQGWKIFFCQTIFCRHKFHKTEYYFIFDLLKKKIWPNFPRIIEVFTQKIVTKPLKIWVWDPGSWIRDPGSGKNLFRIPDPGVKKSPDPGSGSATLVKSMYSVLPWSSFAALPPRPQGNRRGDGLATPHF